MAKRGKAKLGKLKNLLVLILLTFCVVFKLYILEESSVEKLNLRLSFEICLTQTIFCLDKALPYHCLREVSKTIIHHLENLRTVFWGLITSN